MTNTTDTPEARELLTDAMIEAGALEYSIHHQSTCYPRASDFECEAAAKAIFAAMQSRATPPVEMVERVARAIAIPEHHTSWDSLPEFGSDGGSKDLYRMQAEYALKEIAAMTLPDDRLRVAREALEQARVDILCVLGAERDHMTADGVACFQNIAKRIDTALTTLGEPAQSGEGK